jgi:pimeloyl-ACP methyl ester carboxylesterase
MEEKQLMVRDGMFDVRYQVGGSGYPLVFFHGSGGLTPGDFLDELAKDYTVYAPIHPGFAESTGLEHIEDIIDLALYYGDFFDAIGIRKAHVVGHSLGGMLAAEFAVVQAQYVDKLVVANPVGFWREEAPVLDFMSTPPEELGRAVLHDVTGEAAQKLFAPMAGEEGMLKAMFEQHKSFSAAAKFLWPIPDKGLKRRIHRIKAPTLILWGESDGLVPPVYAEDFKSGIKDSKVVILEKTSHMPMYEDVDAFVGAVRDFLK